MYFAKLLTLHRPPNMGLSAELNVWSSLQLSITLQEVLSALSSVETYTIFILNFSNTNLLPASNQ